jgi:hypothetical protein
MASSARCRLLVTLAAIACGGLACSASALAATPAVTAQAQAADAAFLAYAPAPAGGAGALCLVDTGVNSNPDTQPGLISATAVDGGTGNDVDPDGHGTTMAMVAGGAGHGMIGAWPQLKIVSVRATDVPQPGQEPTFTFDSYANGISDCIKTPSYHVRAIDLALSSSIPPSPDQAQAFANQLAAAHLQNVAILAAAGNSPGAIEEPAAEPGVLAVGAGDPNNAICSFSATTNLTFFAPGCGLDSADPSTDQPTCCGQGTSQASAFASAVLVALMSYDPSLSYSTAESLLVSTAVDGHLDATAAFDAAGLSGIVAAGNANIPVAAPPTVPSTQSATTGATGVSVTEAHWAHGKLTLVVSALATGDRLAVQLDYAHAKSRHVSTRTLRSVFRTAKPSLVLLRVYAAKKQIQGPIKAHVT